MYRMFIAFARNTLVIAPPLVFYDSEADEISEAYETSEEDEISEDAHPLRNDV